MKNKSISFESAFASRYPSRAYLINDFRAALHKSPVLWADLTRVNLSRIRSHLLLSHAPNSVRTLLSTLKAVLNLYAEEVHLPCRDFARVLHVRAVPSQHIALTEDELFRLEQYTPLSTVESDVKILAMREAFCGARGSDAATLSPNNITSDGFLTYVSRKTKVQTTVPLHHLITKYLHAAPTKSYSRATINTVLQRMCRRVAICRPCTVFVSGHSVTKPKYQLVTLHTMRRTFCTILALRGVPIELIRLYAGHTSQFMTQHYIVGDPTTPCSEASAFFNPQSQPTTVSETQS